MSDSQTAVHVLKHHFRDMEQQNETAGFGMWLFLVTEIMFFGGLFCAYLIYRYLYFDSFAAASSKARRENSVCAMTASAYAVSA